MSDRNTVARRSVLTAVGGAVLTTGTVSGFHDRRRRRRARRRVTAVENGIVIVHEGCGRAHVYGRDSGVSEVVLSFVWDDDGMPGTGRVVLDDPTFPLTVDADDTQYGAADPAMSVAVIGEDGRTLARGTAPERCLPDVE